MITNKGKSVFVGLSGGVDSSVSAFLLKQAGFNVTGVFIKVWQPDFIVCNWRNEMQDAMRICAKLDIPFLMCDSEKEYKEFVIDYMISEYKKGRTPNPDVMCNKYVKFNSFLDFALKHGADYIATGHYAQNIFERGEYHLKESEDKEKDQTYFLWNLNQKILTKVLFPIGHLTKKEVRKIAEENDLITAFKKDSQGLCFIGNIEMKNFLQHFVPEKIGNVLNEKGKIIGRHKGSTFYTLGERHNFEIFEKTDADKPYYIVTKNLKENTITVSNEPQIFSQKEIRISDSNFIKEIPEINTRIFARSRYRQKKVTCAIKETKNKDILVEFEDPQKNLASGQSVVFYRDCECLGGGIIF